MQDLATIAARLKAALASANSAEARQMLAILKERAPRNPNTWLAAAEVEGQSSAFGPMAEAIRQAQRCGADANLCQMLLARAKTGLGEVEAGIQLAADAARGLTGPLRIEALIAHAEALDVAGRVDEIIVSLESHPDFAASPPGRFLRAQAERRLGRADAAVALLRDLASGDGHRSVRRRAGFELIKALDSLGRYREAFDAALELHAATGKPFDTSALVQDVRRATEMAERGLFTTRSRPSRPAANTALICALPRSGTTLLEQMLDCHPRVVGLGELTAVEELAAGISSLAGWPDGVRLVERRVLDRVQAAYLATARGGLRDRPDAITLDKTLHTWHRLPALATALEGAKFLRVVRDPRDNALSLLFASMQEQTLGWNTSLESIRRVIEAERSSVERIARALGADLLTVRYESLVADPERELRRVLTWMGLPWDSACLAPEANRRLVMTLSHEQVKRPVTRDRAGRWRHYAERFGAEWESLVVPADQ